MSFVQYRSNNTNKLSPQEQENRLFFFSLRSNNTNKLSPQEHPLHNPSMPLVQIIQINLVLKNDRTPLPLTLQFK